MIMTILERVNDIVKNYKDSTTPEGKASVEKMILMAFWIGREEAVKEVSDMYSEHIKKQHERADSCRYHQLTNYVVGPEKYLYHPDYRGDMTECFGSDPSDI